MQLGKISGVNLATLLLEHHQDVSCGSYNFNFIVRYFPKYFLYFYIFDILVPGQPPKTDIGSFEIAENSASRDVYLYWQAIPQYLENGDNFRYEVVHVEESGRKVFLFPNETTRTYAKFNGISNNNYRFEIVSTNVVGANDERAKLFVPSQFKSKIKTEDKDI